MKLFLYFLLNISLISFAQAAAEREKLITCERQLQPWLDRTYVEEMVNLPGRGFEGAALSTFEEPDGWSVYLYLEKMTYRCPIDDDRLKKCGRACQGSASFIIEVPNVDETLYMNFATNDLANTQDRARIRRFSYSPKKIGFLDNKGNVKNTFMFEEGEELGKKIGLKCSEKLTTDEPQLKDALKRAIQRMKTSFDRRKEYPKSWKDAKPYVKALESCRDTIPSLADLAAKEIDKFQKVPGTPPLNYVPPAAPSPTAY